MAGSRLDEDDVPEAEEHIAPVDDDAYGEDALDAPLENPDAADEEEVGRRARGHPHMHTCAAQAGHARGVGSEGSAGRACCPC